MLLTLKSVDGEFCTSAPVTLVTMLTSHADMDVVIGRGSESKRSVFQGADVQSSIH